MAERSAESSNEPPTASPVSPAPPPEEPAPAPPEEPAPPEPEPPKPPAPPPTPPPTPTGAALAGLWEGRATEGRSNHNGAGKPARAMIDQFGRMQLIVGAESNPEFVLHGNVCCESALSEDVTGLRFERPRGESVTLDIALSGGRLVGEFDFRGRHRFDLAPSPVYPRSLSLQDLAGVYARSDTGPGPASREALTWVIDANGSLTGSHTSGCNYSGRISIPNPQRNLARLEVQLAGCRGRRAAWNGSYEGLAFLQGDVLHQSLVGPTWTGAQPLER